MGVLRCGLAPGLLRPVWAVDGLEGPVWPPVGGLPKPCVEARSVACL